MAETLVAPWACEVCHRGGVVSGERERPADPLDEPAPINCYFCQATVLVRLPEGLPRAHLRVEGRYDDLPGGTRCPECAGDVEAYWDEGGTPLLLCTRCRYVGRVPEPPKDPAAWEVLLQTRDEKIERRRVPGGWQFRSESYAATGWRRAPYKRVSVFEGFEPEPGRPLSEVFRDIRAEHLRMREEERLRRARPPRE